MPFLFPSVVGFRLAELSIVNESWRRRVLGLAGEATEAANFATFGGSREASQSTPHLSRYPIRVEISSMIRR